MGVCNIFKVEVCEARLFFYVEAGRNGCTLKALSSGVFVRCTCADGTVKGCVSGRSLINSCAVHRNISPVYGEEG